MYIARSGDGASFGPPEKLGGESWELNACPMDGGGLAVFHGSLVSAWRREGKVYVAEPGRSEVAVGEGKDVAVAAGARGPYIAWVAASGIEVRLPEPANIIRVSEKGLYPTLTALGDGSVLAAWEEDGTIRTHHLP